MRRNVGDDLVAHEGQGELVIIGAAAENNRLIAGRAQLLGELRPIGPTINEKIASMSDLMPGMYGPKSLVPKGTQFFCTTLPPQSSKAFWNPPTCSYPKA